MKDKLYQLLQSLQRVEVKGDSVLILADCMMYLESLIRECEREEVTENAS